MKRRLLIEINTLIHSYSYVHKAVSSAWFNANHAKKVVLINEIEVTPDNIEEFDLKLICSYDGADVYQVKDSNVKAWQHNRVYIEHIKNPRMYGGDRKRLSKNNISFEYSESEEKLIRYHKGVEHFFRLLESSQRREKIKDRNYLESK